MSWALVLLHLGWWPAVAAGSELVISNRAPNPNEIGYRPADGATVPLNPPSFIWLHEKPAASYAIQWARRPDFQDARSADGFVWNTYRHDAPLEPGTWYWRYRFTTAGGQTSGWSAVRCVVVPDEATAFPMPGRAEQRRRVPCGHPRLFLRPEDLPRLRALAAGELADRFRRLQAEADRILQAGPTPEPTHRGSARDKEDLEAIKYWWPNREQTEQACREAETLAFVYLISQDKKYGEAARRWVLHLAAWDPDGPTNFRLNCEAAKPLLYRPARAYGWAHDMFTAAKREQICAAMQRRGQDTWKSGEIARGTGHLNSPFNSHGNRIWHKVGEAGIAFLGEIPQAENWLDYAVNKFFACYPIWADDDGGWHEGVSYWAGYMGKAVWWLHVSRTALGIDGLKKPFFAHVGDYPLSIAPPGSPNATCTAASSITNGRTAPWPTTACWWTGKARSSTPPPRMGGSSNRTFVRSSTTSWAMRPPPMARGWNGFGATRSWSSPGRQRPIRFRGSRCTTTCAPPSRRRSSSCCTG